MTKLLQGDCLELMKGIPDKSVDLILTDPPYNIGKASWDKIPDYVNWCGKWIEECERVLKDNGSFYFWHNDMVQIAQLMEWIRQNTRLVFNSFVIWDKGDFRALSWKNPRKNNKLRSWFNTCEYCLFFTLQSEQPLRTELNYAVEEFRPIFDYFTEEQRKTGLNCSQLDDLMNRKSAYSYFRKKTSHGIEFPTEENYIRLQKTGHFQLAYAELKEIYTGCRENFESKRYVHHLDEHHNNVWRSQERNNGKQHPTQKPNDLMERIIKTSSNQGDTVLDLFMGSGTTGVACLNTNRNFIGMELDENYFNIATNRINNHKVADD